VVTHHVEFSDRWKLMNEDQKSPWVVFSRDYQETWRQIHDANINVPSHVATTVCHDN
jgi:hypothetical protein